VITVLAGGVGAARLLSGLIQVVDPTDLTAIVNTGDDLVLHGLEISPDLDTVTYTVAGAIDPERGWGLAGETWTAMESLRRFGGEAWFNLGDQDLGTHLYRTTRRHEGATLTEVTAEIATGFGLGLRLLPVTDDELRTRVTVAEGEISFQEYFVHRQHGEAVSAIRFAGAESTAPGPDVLAAIAGADQVVIAPSNPIVSIGPLLAVPGVRDAVIARRDDVVAVSPIVAGPFNRGTVALFLPILMAGLTLERGSYRAALRFLRQRQEVVSMPFMNGVVPGALQESIPGILPYRLQ